MTGEEIEANISDADEVEEEEDESCEHDQLRITDTEYNFGEVVVHLSCEECGIVGFRVLTAEDISWDAE